MFAIDQTQTLAQHSCPAIGVVLLLVTYLEDLLMLGFECCQESRAIDRRRRAPQQDQPRHTVLRHPGCTAVGVVRTRAAAVAHLMLRVNGNPEIGWRAYYEAAEARFCDAGHREREAVDHQRGPNDGKVAAELPLPQPVTDHRGESLTLSAIVGGRQHAALDGSNANDVKPVSADELRGDELRGAVDGRLHRDRRRRN